jgi:uncharacterized protein
MSMRYLLDINVLIALMDPDHTFHQLAHQWWNQDDRPWASCPITENGFIRIMASTSYSKNSQLSVADVTTLLSVFTANTNHEFWSDHISLRDEIEFQHATILSSKHLTDIYLLAIAAKKNATLVTFDQNIPLSPVKSAKSENLLIL